MKSDRSLFDACVELGRVHRVVVTKPDGIPIGLLAQSTVVQFLNQHLAEFGTELSRPITDYGLGTHGVTFIPQSGTALNAFKQMLDKKISSVGICEDDKLLTVISTSDIKHVLTKGTLTCLNENVVDFASEIRLATAGDEAAPSIQIHNTGTLDVVIKKLVATKIHRLYVTHDQGKPVGVVTLTDILRAVTNSVK